MSATSDPSTTTTDAPAGSVAAPGAPAAPPAPPDTYTVNRAQDGAQVRAQLTLGQAKEECAILNGQARTEVGTTTPVFNRRQELVQGPVPIFGSMYHGQICRYEVRSTTTGLVIA